MLCGEPLISYTIREALNSQLLTKYIVSTDCPEIPDVAVSYGAEVPFLRPPELSSDAASSVSALQHAVQYMETGRNFTYDYAVELMVTNPLKTVYDIDGCILKILSTGADSVIAMHRLEDHHPARIKKIIDGKIRNFCVDETPESRRQDFLPAAYIRNRSIYVMTRSHLMIDHRRYGSDERYAWVLDNEKVINIDTELDFLVAEQMLRKITSQLPSDEKR